MSFWEDRSLVIDGDSPTRRSHYPEAVYPGQEGQEIKALGIVRSVIVKQITYIDSGWSDFLLTIVSTGKSVTISCMFYSDLDLIPLLDGRGIIFRSASLFDSRIKDLPPDLMLEADIWDVLFCFVTREGLVRDIHVFCYGHSVDSMRIYFDTSI